MRRLSLRAWLTIWCVVVVVACVAFFAADVLILQERIGIRRIDRELDTIQAQLTNMLREELHELDSPKLAAEESRGVISADGHPLAVFSDDGAVLATSFDAPTLTAIFRNGPPAVGVRTVGTPTGAMRLHITRETLEGVSLGLIVASGLTDLARDQREIREAVVLGIPVALIFAAAGGLWLASIGLRPITTMARRAASIPLTGIEDLGQPARNDELGQLTAAFNALVARLRAALQTQRQFMADASHELRNPVSVIRTASDVALSCEHRDESEYRDALAMTSTQSRRLSTLVEDMLVLARADAGGYPLRPVDLFLDDVIDECGRAVSVLAAERQVNVTTSGATEVALRGDQELLRRLFVNLLQNAVQHTPAGGTVCVDVSVDSARTYIRVIDEGQGIPDADRARIFDRFVQLDPSRRSEGAGLGLPIAEWIARAHGGSLTVESSSPRGTTFCVGLSMPAALAGCTTVS
jgi:heavy metal sensor kinase